MLHFACSLFTVTENNCYYSAVSVSVSLRVVVVSKNTANWLQCVCVTADDRQALIWDIQQMPRAIEDPILAYTAAGEINQIQWSSTQPDWIAICYNNCLEILRV